MIHTLKVPQYYAVEDLTCFILESLTGSKDLLLSAVFKEVSFFV